MNYSKDVTTEDRPDHELGLRLAEMLGLSIKRATGLCQTAWGSKTPAGLARSIRRIVNKEVA